MQIDFAKELVDLDGIVLMEAGKPITLSAVCKSALMLETKEDKLTGSDKLKRFDLALAIHGAKEPLELPVEDLALLKDLTGKIFGPIIVGQVWHILDG